MAGRPLLSRAWVRAALVAAGAAGASAVWIARGGSTGIEGHVAGGFADGRGAAGATPAPARRIAGRITLDGRPVAARVALVSDATLAGAVATPNAAAGLDGRFAFDHVPPGAWQVTATGPGLTPAWIDVAAGAAPADLELALGRCRDEAYGQVVDDAGAPVAGARISGRRPGARSPAPTTAAGSAPACPAAWSGSPRGPRASAPGPAASTSRARSAPTSGLAREAVIAGRVTTPGGAPVARRGGRRQPRRPRRRRRAGHGARGRWRRRPLPSFAGSAPAACGWRGRRRAGSPPRRAPSPSSPASARVADLVGRRAGLGHAAPCRRLGPRPPGPGSSGTASAARSSPAWSRPTAASSCAVPPGPGHLEVPGRTVMAPRRDAPPGDQPVAVELADAARVRRPGHPARRAGRGRDQVIARGPGYAPRPPGPTAGSRSRSSAPARWQLGAESDDLGAAAPDRAVQVPRRRPRRHRRRRARADLRRHASPARSSTAAARRSRARWSSPRTSTTTTSAGARAGPTAGSAATSCRAAPASTSCARSRPAPMARWTTTTTTTATTRIAARPRFARRSSSPTARPTSSASGWSRPRRRRRPPRPRGRHRRRARAGARVHVVTTGFAAAPAITVRRAGGGALATGDGPAFDATGLPPGAYLVQASAGATSDARAIAVPRRRPRRRRARRPRAGSRHRPRRRPSRRRRGRRLRLRRGPVGRRSGRGRRRRRGAGPAPTAASSSRSPSGDAEVHCWTLGRWSDGARAIHLAPGAARRGRDPGRRRRAARPRSASGSSSSTAAPGSRRCRRPGRPRPPVSAPATSSSPPAPCRSPA